MVGVNIPSIKGGSSGILDRTPRLRPILLYNVYTVSESEIPAKDGTKSQEVNCQTRSAGGFGSRARKARGHGQTQEAE